ncbi:MAG: phosphoglycerate kinase, partial [Candidatus Thermoplasmatota archaeon]|nr:phosphoglycerate kinase [Candidatus Thermoplasmatota archaeon]
VRFDTDEVTISSWNGENFTPQADTALVRNLAPLADIFVNDAFAAAHRCQPSLVGFTEVLPMATGLVMERELRKLGGAIADGPTPRIALLGGSKAADSVAIAHHFLSQGVDEILTGGVVANLFLMADGVDIGAPSTAYIRDHITNWEQVVADAEILRKEFGDRLVVPIDVAVSEEGVRHGLPVNELPAKYPVHDIGIETLVAYLARLEKAGTVIANGPMGVFENPEFATGTRELFTAIADSDALTVVGGGETTMAFTHMGLADRVNHVSTGGGACIAFMSGRLMPVLEALRHSKKRFDEGGYEK